MTTGSSSDPGVDTLQRSGELAGVNLLQRGGRLGSCCCWVWDLLPNRGTGISPNVWPQQPGHLWEGTWVAGSSVSQSWEGQGVKKFPLGEATLAHSFSSSMCPQKNRETFNLERKS